MKSIFKFYFILIGTILGLAFILPIFRLVDLSSANSLMITKIIILVGYLYLGMKTIYLIIQFYYRKELIIRNSFNWTVSICNWFAGGVILLGYWMSQSGTANALILGIGCILAGFIHLPRFIKLDKDSMTIFEANNKRIKYKDLINIDYKDKILSFDTELANYKLKMMGVDSNKIAKIREVIKNSKDDDTDQ